MTNTDDSARIHAAYKAMLHIAALDRRKRTAHWNAECAAALAQAEAVISSTPGRLLLVVTRKMREGGPQAHDPCAEPTRDTNERSQRPRHDGLYEDASMRARLG